MKQTQIVLRWQKLFLVLLALFVPGNALLYADDPLTAGFKNPPASAKARTWWHWINGNVTKAGITADLEAMKKVGIQEAQIFNVSLGDPRGPATYLSPQWLELFKFSALEAKRLGLELGFHNGPGWSSSGGPWITPEHSMQTVVYSTTTHHGGKPFEGKLAQPESQLDFYRDIAILAFPTPKKNQRVENLDFKTLSGRMRNRLTPDSATVPSAAIVPRSDIIDLTSRLTADGFLQWNAPPGQWTILRLGHTPTGHRNRPAPHGAQGLECDKMNREAVDAFWKGGIDPIIETLDGLVGPVLNNCVIDSYEVGTTNWTSGFEKQFNRLRGYDCTAYLPTLAGYYVDSGEITERFLWDFRRTIGDLIAANYYEHFRQKCHQHAMKLSVEPYWGPFDSMQVGQTGDIVMCEFWSGDVAFFDTPKFVASIAKLNGDSIVGAEAFTGQGAWTEHPATIKSIGDRAWAQGINRFIFHSYVHQPWDVGPGLTLSYHGLEFNRFNTWWEPGAAFLDYIARSQFLLQQGESVADVLVFTGEASPNNAFVVPEIKAMGFDYDLIGVNKLDALTVKDGLIRTATGASYRALVLPDQSRSIPARSASKGSSEATLSETPKPSLARRAGNLDPALAGGAGNLESSLARRARIDNWMRPETIRKLAELADAGATILGSKPVKSPSLQGYPECDQTVSKLADNLWEGGSIREQSIVDWLRDGDISPDFDVENDTREDLAFIHRRNQNAEIYFVANAGKEKRDVRCRFRVSGKQPELWDAETAEIRDAMVWQDNGDGTTSVPINFANEDSVFVVFRKPVTSADHIVEADIEMERQTAEPLHGLEIIKAEYGTFLPDGLADVTDILRGKVQNNVLDAKASRALFDCDPAPGYKKELRVKYMIGSTITETTVMEQESVKIKPTNEAELKILNAVFGKFDQQTKGVPTGFSATEVTAAMKKFVSSGIYTIPVDGKLAGNSIDQNQRNRLRITYTTDGEMQTLSIPAGKNLRLTRQTPGPKLVSSENETSWVTPLAGQMSYRLASGKTNSVQVKTVAKPIQLTGPWKVSFQNGSAQSAQATFTELESWTKSSIDSIRYFSGTASYQKEFSVPSHLNDSDTSLELDLGNVREIAEVLVNGRPAATLWKPPFRISLDGFLKEGQNTLEVKVTNLWANRLIGDEQLPNDVRRKGRSVRKWPDWLLNQTERSSKRVGFAAYQHFSRDSTLQSSGLLGPVVIRPYVRVGLKIK